MLSSEAKCLAHLQDYASCECVRPPNPLEQKTAYDVSASARHHGMSCTTREGRPSFQGRPCLSDAWLSCAGPGELAPEIGIFNHNSIITDSAGVWFHGTPSKLCAVQHALRLGAEPSWARWRFQRSGEEGGRRWLRTLPIGLSSILSKSWFSRPALPWSRWLSFLLGTSCPS